jgi:hypothetical protein
MRALRVWLLLVVFLMGSGVTAPFHHVHDDSYASSSHCDSHRDTQGDDDPTHEACPACVAAHAPGLTAPLVPALERPDVALLVSSPAAVAPVLFRAITPHQPRGPPTHS